MRTHVLHYLPKLSSGFGDFYPLYKNRFLLESKGIKTNFFYNISESKTFGCDLIIIHVRFKFENEGKMFNFFNSLK